MYATQYIVSDTEFFFKNLRLRKAITSCAGSRLNMSKHTSVLTLTGARAVEAM